MWHTSASLGCCAFSGAASTEREKASERKRFRRTGNMSCGKLKEPPPAMPVLGRKRTPANNLLVTSGLKRLFWKMVGCATRLNLSQQAAVSARDKSTPGEAWSQKCRLHASRVSGPAGSPCQCSWLVAEAAVATVRQPRRIRVLCRRHPRPEQRRPVPTARRRRLRVLLLPQLEGQAIFRPSLLRTCRRHLPTRQPSLEQ